MTVLARKRWMTVEDSSELPFRSAHGCSPVRGLFVYGHLAKNKTADRVVCGCIISGRVRS